MSAVEGLIEAMAGAGVRWIVAISAQPVLRGGAGEPWWHRPAAAADDLPPRLP
ncbi:hypothetical protein [Nonomuraea recticatena]|uniref:hypothetical protein n=1 Tax=Nonomuraea recticatena TaxID=46178 RepID=UPI0031F856C8